MDAGTITIAARFAGPPGSANGGYTAGRLAAHVTKQPRPVTVTLLRPPPLEVELNVEVGATCQLLDAGTTIATAAEGEFRSDAVAPLDHAAALRAHASYAGLVRHPFPRCFVCGPERAAGDGLRLQPGAVASGRTACVWIPDPSSATPDSPEVAAVEFAWAALDCPGGWTSDLDARPLVLGRMTALCDEGPLIGHPHVVVGRHLGNEGRKTFTATTLYDNDGRILGRAEHTWIAVDPATFNAP